MTEVELKGIFDKYVSVINRAFGADFYIASPDFPFTEIGNTGESFLLNHSSLSWRLSLGKTMFEASQRLISLFYILEQFDKIQSIIRKDLNQVSIFFIDG